MADADLDQVLRGFNAANDRDNRRVNGHVARPSSLQSPLVGGVDIIAKFTLSVVSMIRLSPQTPTR